MPQEPAPLTSLADIRSTVLLTTFTSKKKKYKVFLHQNRVIWEREKAPFEQTTLLVEDIIAVRYVNKPASHPLNDPLIDPNSFVIHYAKRAPKSTWKYARIVFQHNDSIQVQSWVMTLQKYLQSFSQRPKNLLIFVNPFGGKRDAMKIYEKIAKPLFQIADVETTVNVSQRKDQICDYVTYHSLEMYDAIACVGGDGTLSELFNGLVRRECRLKQLDLDDMSVELPKPTIPIGVIPGGSTDTIAYCLHGSSDIQTAVLQIIFGNRLGVDLVSVYDESKLVRLYASVNSYGYLGDVAHQSDKYRWMGPKRYDYSGFRKLLRNKGYEGEIAILRDSHSSSSERKVKCYEDCVECKESKERLTTVESSKWSTVRGKFFMISGANISCACARSPNGIAPYSHLGDGKVHLILVKHTSHFNLLRMLLRLTLKRKDIYSLPFVEIHQTREFCFRAINGRSKWNCDGEVLLQTNIRARVRCQLLTMFGRGPPECKSESEDESFCSFC